jgi:hypothetical protein
MSAKYFVFGPLDLHKLDLQPCYFLMLLLVFMFCRLISEEWQNLCGIAWKIRKF